MIMIMTTALNDDRGVLVPVRRRNQRQSDGDGDLAMREWAEELVERARADGGERESMKTVRAVVKPRLGEHDQLSRSGLLAYGRTEDTFQAEKRQLIGQIDDNQRRGLTEPPTWVDRRYLVIWPGEAFAFLPVVPLADATFQPSRPALRGRAPR